jgi:PAS domain S-box-containing protein
LHDAREVLAGVILSFTDVAELRQAEAERARLAAIVTSSEDAIVGKTLDGIITSWNPGAERLFGYPADEAIGQPMLMVFPPEYREEEAYLLACVRRGEAVPAFDTVRMRRDGTHVPVAVSLSPIHDGSGQIVGVSKIARDITGRVALEAARQADQLRLEELVVARTEALAEKERHLQSILDGMPGMVAYWDANECLQFANRLHHLKHGSRDALGVSMAELLGPLAYAHARPHVEAVLQGEVRSFEASLGTLPEGGLDDMVQINFVPDVVKDQVQGFIVMIFDISPMKKAEAAAEAASRAKSEFLANMSHEIRTPLNAVLGLAQVAQRRHASEPVADTLTMIVQAGQHLLGVINDVLDFSKIEAGKLDLQIGCVDVSEWLGKAVSMVADQARDKGLSLRVSRDPALAPAYAGDAVRLAQILINLLTNAVKFTEKGQVELVVRSDGDGLSLVVSDSGIGMSESVMARLFSPFEQGDGSTTRRFGGTGLGLSICKRLVALMKGRISVSSEPGVGSRFDIWLPLQPLVSQAVDVNQPGRGAPLSWAMPPSGERLKGLRLLVAEDHPVNQMVLAQLLEMEGAELVMVAHGGLAVEQVHEQGADAFNLVLCDIEMPVMDGYEATRQIKALASGLPVVGLTAHAFEDARLRGAEAGMVDYVTKPYMVDTLVLAILRHAVGVVLQPAPVAVKTPSVSVGPYGIDRQALALHYRTLPDFVPRLLSMVRQTCESQPALLQAALDEAQPERLRYLAHGVAGMAANLLMPELRALAHKLEQASERSLQEAAPLVAELKDALATLCGHLDAS